MRERKKLTMVKAQAYVKAGKAKKSAMLDDFCESTGYCRRYAARVLHQAGQQYLLGDCTLVADPAKHIHRYRPPRYGPATLKALITIWAASTFLGPVRLAAGMPLFVENLVIHGHLRVDEETRRLLLQMSPATIGRLLAGERKKYRLHGISHTRGTPLGGRIPMQTCMDPPLDIPGVLAVDLVGHDGGHAVDDFGWTLTVTDCTTGWTEAGAVRTKAEVYVVAALESCLRRYPGQVISLHSDNGSEFMNGHLVRFCHTQGITLTRSRPYHKNDNPHVEEKNNSIIRKFVGYDRHDTQEEVDLLNRLYQTLHLLVNWFLPSQKLLHKVRDGSHITKVYDQAQTPCTRMLAREDVSEETKQQLRSTRAKLDLTSLHHEILLYQDRLDAIAKRRQPRAIIKRGNYAYFLDESTT
ncbi:MAG: DDE-type integrase/transposase/recombinase [Candidatus Cryosericum sp.]